MWAKINDGAQAMFEKVTGKEAPERFKRSNSSRRFSTLSFFKPAQEKPLTETSSTLAPSTTENQTQPRSQAPSQPTQDAVSSPKATEHQAQVSPAPAMSSPPIKNVMIAGVCPPTLFSSYLHYRLSPILTVNMCSPYLYISPPRPPILHTFTGRLPYIPLILSSPTGNRPCRSAYSHCAPVITPIHSLDPCPP